MKPDWATRLQRTFARKYDAGFAKGLMLGKAVATRDEQERIIGLIEDNYLIREITGVPLDSPHNRDVQRVIALIKGGK